MSRYEQDCSFIDKQFVRQSMCLYRKLTSLLEIPRDVEHEQVQPRPLVDTSATTAQNTVQYSVQNLLRNKMRFYTGSTEGT